MQLRKSVQQTLDLQDKLCIMTAARNEAVKQLDATRKALRGLAAEAAGGVLRAADTTETEDLSKASCGLRLCFTVPNGN